MVEWPFETIRASYGRAAVALNMPGSAAVDSPALMLVSPARKSALLTYSQAQLRGNPDGEPATQMYFMAARVVPVETMDDGWITWLTRGGDVLVAERLSRGAAAA